MIGAACILFLAAAYRLRGGGWVTLGSDTICRAIWALAVTGAYAALAWPYISLFYLCLLPPLSFAAIAAVPHGYAQNMGRWPVPQKKWPSILMPTISVSRWQAWAFVDRESYDAASMAFIGLIRGLGVFLPALLFGYYWIDVAKAVACVALLQPIAYAVGWYMPLTLGKSLNAHSAVWGEFFTGAVWGLALILLTQ